MHREKHMYQRIYEFIENWVAEHGTRRGAFAAAAEIFYPHLPRRIGVKRAYDMYTYAVRRVFGTRYSEFPEHSSEHSRVTDAARYNTRYLIEAHSGPLPRSINRQVYEFKKLLYAVLQPFIPRSTLNKYIEGIIRDKRVQAILYSSDKIWYNGERYVKLSPKTAALLYIAAHRIYTMHHGAGNKPLKLIKRYFQVTSIGPRDLEKEIRELVSVFYDWLLFLG